MKGFLVCLLFFGIQAQAVDLSKYTGKFRSSSQRGTMYATATHEGNSLILALGSGWNERVRGKSYEFLCVENRCQSRLPEIHVDCIGEMLLLNSGSFLFQTLTPQQCQGSHRFDPYYGPVDSGKWKVAQKVDESGVLSVTASVKNNEKKNTLLLQCKAPSSDLKMSFELNEVLWRAVSYSVNNKQESLKVTLKVGSESFELNQWSVEDNNMIVRLDQVVEAELKALKKGSSVNVLVQTVNSANQEKTDLSTFNFSLKGSSAAIVDLQKRCTFDAQSFVPTFIEVGQ